MHLFQCQGHLYNDIRRWDSHRDLLINNVTTKLNVLGKENNRPIKQHLTNREWEVKQSPRPNGTPQKKNCFKLFFPLKPLLDISHRNPFFKHTHQYRINHRKEDKKPKH